MYNIHMNRTQVALATVFFTIAGAALVFLYTHQDSINATKYQEVQQEYNPAPDLNLTQLYNLVNIDRASEGLPALNRNTTLDNAATLKCADMVANDYWGHISPTGVKPWTWYKNVGYSYEFAGENLAYGQIDSEDVSDEWMKSPGHRKNIMSSNFTEVGYAQCKYPKESKFGHHTLIVQMFANPAQ